MHMDILEFWIVHGGLMADDVDMDPLPPPIIRDGRPSRGPRIIARKKIVADQQSALY